MMVRLFGFLWLFGSVACVVGQEASIVERVPTDEGQGTARDQPADDYELMRLFVDAIDEVELNYVAPITRRELMEAAIEGVLSKLDNYSNYIAPEEMFEFQRDVEQEFGGIGIQINEAASGNIRIVSPLAGTPASRAGLQAGDEITHIEGKATAQIGVEGAVTRMKGPVGSQVRLTIDRAGKSFDVVLNRETVQLETVIGVRRRANSEWDFFIDPQEKIGYVRIASFGAHTTDDLKEAVRGLHEQQIRGLVLDLRNNPGGLLTAAIEVSDLFLTKGDIVSAQGRNVPVKKWEALPGGSYTEFPMAVLVNSFSASGSEIVAACLQDNRRAVVIGERTWGKGSVQRLVMLQDGKSALKLTTSTYLRPNGKNIHRTSELTDSDDWGVRPDEGYEVKLSRSEQRAMLIYQRDAFLIRGNDDTKKALPFYVDAQVKKAFEYLRVKSSRP
jgi:carboxyl-terminal processing protease